MEKRPLCIATICYMIGITMGLYLKISIVFLLCIFILVAIILLTISRRKSFMIFLIITLVGILCVKYVDSTYEQRYQSLEQNTEYKIEATIVSEAVEKEYKMVYEIKIKNIDGVSDCKGKKWLLNIRKRNSKDNKIDEEHYFELGDVITFTGLIEIPSGARNYMGFDYQQYLKTQRIYGTITVSDKIGVVKQHEVNFLKNVWYIARKSIKKNIYMLLPEGARELCLGLLIGEKKEINEEVEVNFSKSNLKHMLAVSGAHVSYVILLLSLLLCKTTYRFRRICMIIFLLFFVGLTGFTPSVERASFMTILTLLAGLIHRKQDIDTNLCFSCFAICISNPYAIWDVGFQLSYGGTIGIILFYRKLSKAVCKKLCFSDNDVVEGILTTSKQKEKPKLKIKIRNYVLENIIVTISANLIILPIMAFHFHTISFSFWISNLLAGPFLGLIMILGFILYLISIFCMPCANIIAFPLQYLLNALMLIAQFCSHIPFSSITVRTPFMFEIIFYYFILFIFYQFSYFKKKILKIISGFMIILIICYEIVGMLNDGKLRIYFVDIGQGDCTLICTPNSENILIDGGGSETGSFDVGEKTLLPYLLNRKITEIDYMIVSHFDTDHVRTGY